MTGRERVRAGQGEVKLGFHMRPEAAQWRAERLVVALKQQAEVEKKELEPAWRGTQLLQLVSSPAGR